MKSSAFYEDDATSEQLYWHRQGQRTFWERQRLRIVVGVLMLIWLASCQLITWG